MKKFTLIILTLFTMFFVLGSCKGNKKTSNKEVVEKSEETQECTDKAIVVDYTGLSGCSYLLRLSDGSYLNPGGIKREDLARSYKVKVGYEVVQDAMSNCMKGKIVNVTCFTILKEGTPEKGRFE